MTRRLEERIFRLNEEIEALRRDEHLAREELVMHRHLNDDAQRDAAVSGHPFDTMDAEDTAGDVVRMEKMVESLARKRARLEEKRSRLLQRLA